MATDLGKAYVQIVPSAKGISGNISKVLNGEAISAGENTGNTIGTRLIGNLKKIIVGAGIGNLIKDTISQGAKLEQSIGGIETMFKDQSETMIKYANEAWKTAGISANDYMQNVTSFSASLLQGLGGDTAKAAEIANQAMLDMADNSNKFGTDMQSIQNAYQGFAKQNYTMLDNLKLGYGGTKTEMERLLKDAEKLSGIKYDISNLGDVYSAIHVIQEEMGVTGTTAQEAMTTVSGSLNAVKASAQNLMASLALGENVGASLESLLSTSVTFGKNVLGMVGNILNELPGVARTAFNKLIYEGMPMITNWVKNLASGVQNAFPTLLNQVLTSVSNISVGLRRSFGTFFDAGMELLLNIANGIANSIPTLIQHVPTIITNIAGIINDNAPKLISTGFQIIVSLVKGVVNAIPELINNFGKIIESIFAVWQAVNWLSLGSNLIDLVKAGIKKSISVIPDILKSIGEKALNIFKSINWLGLGKAVIDFIANGISNFASNIGTKLKSAGTNAMNIFKEINWIELGKSVINGIVNGITNIASNIGIALKNAATSAFNIIKGLNWFSIGSDIVDGISSGISSGSSRLNSVAGGVARGAYDHARQTLDIKSPSKKFYYLGQMSDEGLAKGLSQNMGVVYDAIDDITSGMLDTLNPDLSIGVGNNSIRRPNDNAGFTQTINNYSPKALSPSETARLTRNSTRQLVLGLRMGG